MGPVVTYCFETVFCLVHKHLHRFELRPICGCDLLDAALDILVDIGFEFMHFTGTCMLSCHLANLFENFLLYFEPVSGEL